MPETCLTCPQDCGAATDSDNDGLAHCIDNCPNVSNPDQADFDGDGLGDACDPDVDGDQVANNLDLCPGTMIPEATPTSGVLHTNRWALHNIDGSFVQAPPQAGSKHGFTTGHTRGCSCEQIVARSGISAEHVRNGCATGVIQQWIARH